jgi:hypothetical protein
MSRARNIKPGFFKNELLVELPFEYRLLFVGLWTMADRAGRLEDRPTKIRMELFPADSVDVDDGLQALHDSGFVQRYEVDGRRYVQVLAWAKHQNPHVKEAKSTIPAPGEHGASTVQAPAKAQASPADSLIPDSLIPDSGEKPSAQPSASRFAEFWDAYPQKRGKKPAEAKWKAKRLDAMADRIVADVRRRLRDDDRWKRGFIPDPATYLNQERWEDALHDVAASARGSPPAAPSKTMQGLMALEDMKRGLVRNRDSDGAAEAALPLAGPDPGA